MATFEFKLPDIGEGIVEGEIVKWLVQVGEQVVEDQPMVEVMTDKATVVIPSPRPGTIAKLHGREGELAKVHKPLVTLTLEEGLSEAVSAPAADSSAESTAPREEGVVHLTPPAQPAQASSHERASGGVGRVLATPVTRRIAREHGISLAAVAGSGHHGRVLKSDVLRAVNGMNQESAVAVVAELRPVPEAPTPSQSVAGDRRIALRGLRRAIAKKMVTSKFTAPHAAFVEELDATELKALRARLNAAAQKSGGPKLTYLPFVLKALGCAFRRFPSFNANFDEATQELVVRAKANIGVGVATAEGLTVPVVKDVGAKSLPELSAELATLSTAAREKRLKTEELTGGSFTVSSLGELGGLFATPIINHPEVAILGVHRMRQVPVARAGAIEVRDMMNLSLSFDHRVIDGAEAASFVYELIRLLEHPELLMLELR